MRYRLRNQQQQYRLLELPLPLLVPDGVLHQRVRAFLEPLSHPTTLRSLSSHHRLCRLPPQGRPS